MNPRLMPHRPPQPGLVMALVWMVGYWTFTQLPGGGIALVWALVALFTTRATPEQWERWAEHPLEIEGLGTGLLVGLGIAQVLAVIYAWILLRNLVGKNWRERIGLEGRVRPGHLIATLLLVPGMVLAANALVALAPKPEMDPAPAMAGLQVGRQVLEDFSKLLASWPSWAALLVVAVGPALAEELFCRGFLGHGLVGRHGVAKGVLWTSILFGVMHLVPVQAVYAAMLGLVLHGLRLGTRSLWAPMLAHFGNNALSVLGACDDSPIKQPLMDVDQWVQGNPLMALALGGGICLAVLGYVGGGRLQGGSPELR